MEVNNKISINNLPQDVLCEIFFKVGTEELGNVARVCKLWNTISSQDQVWLPLFELECKKESCKHLARNIESNKSAKEKMKALYQKMQDLVNYALENKHISVGFFSVFEKKQQRKLENCTLSNKEKVELIFKEVNRFLSDNVQDDYMYYYTMLSNSIFLYPQNSHSNIDLNFNMVKKINKSLEFLLKCGANPNAPNRGKAVETSPTPLFVASYNKQVDDIKKLIEYGADLSVKDNKGKTFVDVLISSIYHAQRDECLELIKKYSALSVKK